MVTSSDELGRELIRVLGLPDNTRKFKLRLKVNRPVLIECEYYPDINTDDITTILTEYELKEKREDSTSHNQQG